MAPQPALPHQPGLVPRRPGPRRLALEHLEPPHLAPPHSESRHLELRRSEPLHPALPRWGARWTAQRARPRAPRNQNCFAPTPPAQMRVRGRAQMQRPIGPVRLPGLAFLFVLRTASSAFQVPAFVFVAAFAARSRLGKPPSRFAGIAKQTCPYDVASARALPRSRHGAQPLPLPWNN